MPSLPKQNQTKGWQRAKKLIIIPAYNEEASIKRVLIDLKQGTSHIPNLTCCVINDGSTDRTIAEIRDLGVHVIDLPCNLGVGGAIRTGYMFARSNEYEIVVHYDADGQHQPSAIELMLEALEASNFVLGSRFLSDTRYESPNYTRFAQRILSRSLQIKCGLFISDPSSGLRASKGSEIIQFFASCYPISYLEDTVGSLVLARNMGYKIIEISTPMKPRIDGKPSQSFLKQIKYFIYALVILIFWPSQDSIK